MDKRQLAFLFIVGSVPWTVGNGVLPLLPVLARSLGASSAIAGGYLAVSYLAITLGALCAGWAAGQVRSHKKLLVVTGLAATPVVWLMGQASNLALLTVVTALLWFMGGMGFALISMMAGLATRTEERGRVFGILSAASPVGALMGGLTSGPMVDRWGFSAMFAVFAVFSLVWPVAALRIKEAAVERSTRTQGSEAGQPVSLGRPFWLLFLSGVAASIASFVCLLGRSLSMDQLGFNAASISATGVASGVVALPVGLLAGYLSDRLGRKRFLAVGYLLLGIGLGVLGLALEVWHFAGAIALMSAQVAIFSAVGAAFAADLVAESALGKGLSIFSAISWIGGIAGFAITGLAIQWIGFRSTFFLASLLPILSLGLLALVRKSAVPEA